MVRIDGDVIRLTTRVEVNESGIGTNATEITRLTGEVNDNLLNIETNQQNIEDQGTLLGEHDLAISALESAPPTDSAPVCAPLFQAVANEMSGLGYRYSGSCGSSCDPDIHNCPEGRDGSYRCSGSSSANPVPYIVRDVNTLNCETRTANFYSSRRCRPNYSGNPCK